MSITTVRRHITAILNRLGVTGRFAAGAAAQRRGWIRVTSLTEGFIRRQRPPRSLVTDAVMAGVAALLDIQTSGDDDAHGDDSGDGQVHARGSGR